MRQDVRGHGVFICACHMSKFDNTNVPSSPHHVIGKAVADPMSVKSSSSIRSAIRAVLTYLSSIIW